MADFSRLNGAEVAELYGVTREAVRQWHVKGGCPRNEDKTFDLAAVIAWREARLEADVADLAGSDNPELQRWRAARADMAEMERDLRRGLLIKREAVEANEQQQVAAVRKALLALPKRLAPKLAGAAGRADLHQTFENAIRQAVVNVCNTFAGRGRGRKGETRGGRAKRRDDPRAS